MAVSVYSLTGDSRVGGGQAKALISNLAEMKPEYGQADCQPERPRMPEQGIGKNLPVVFSSLLSDPQEPHGLGERLDMMVAEP